MAETWPFFSDLVPPQTEKEREEELEAYKKYDTLASTLPTSCKCGPRTLKKYDNFWYIEPLLTATIAIKDTFKARPSDVILATFPKSGTTWLKAIIFSILNRSRYPFTDHPLLTHSSHDCFPFLHTLYGGKRIPTKFLESMPSPRLLADHIPLTSLPPSVIESGCRVIYLCRDPKDIVVSMWHYVLKTTQSSPERFSFEEFCELACQGMFPFSPIWDHMLEYWNESLKRPEQVMFLQYEDLMEDTVGNVRRLACFLSCPFDEEEEKRGVAEEIVSFCGFEIMSGREVNKKGKHGVEVTFENSAFFRKGKVGDWKEHMSEEMAQRLDSVVEEKLHGSGLSFKK